MKVYEKTKAIHQSLEKCLGKKGDHSTYIIRHGENVVFVDDALHDPDILSRLTQVEYETYKEEKTAWETRIFDQTKHLRFKKDPEKFLSELENKWLTE